MAQSNSTNNTHVHGTPLTSITANEIKSLNKEDLNAALSLTNTQASTSLTMEDIEAALILVSLSASSSKKPPTSIHKPRPSSVLKAGQASEIDSQRQKRRKYSAEYWRQRRAKLPKGHRQAEYRKFVAKETDAHHEERLRKKRERYKAKRQEAKRAG